MVDVEQLYKSFGVLADAKDKACEKLDSFKVILAGVTGNTSVKRLSAQFIARFFKHFPKEADDSINALVDLCEDEDVNIRKAAVKELPNLCKADKQYVLRLSDILVQMLNTSDSSELSVVNTSLQSMFAIDAKATLDAVLSQILNGEDSIRQKAIKLLCKFLKTASANEGQLSKEVEMHVLGECKKIMEDVTGDEFSLLMEGLSTLHHIQSIQGRQQLIDMIADQMDLSKDFDVQDIDDFYRVNQCIATALPLCSKNVHGSKFVNFICTKVLPSLSVNPEEAETSKDNGTDEQKDNSKSGKCEQQLEIVKKLAELSNFCGNGETVSDCVPLLFEKLKEYMPLPPALDENGDSASKENPKLQFTHIECLMYTFHQLGKNKQEFLTSEDAAERLKDFRLRLQYLARGTKVYISEIQATVVGKTPNELQSNKDHQIKLIALKTCNNVNTLIKDLFHNPPSYKSSINLSWKKVQSKSKTAASVNNSKKRLSTGDSGLAAKKKDERTLYSAPGGKYSQNISFPRGRGRGRQGGRGGRQQRNNSNGGYRY